MVGTQEEIVFSDGGLSIENDGYRKSWNVELANVENGKTLNAAMRENEQPTLKFVTEDNIEYEGTVLISRISSGNLGVYIDLVGNGPLKGY